MVPIMLVGANFWEELLVQNKLSMIDHSTPVPNDGINKSSCEWCNHILHSWMINYVYDSIAQTILYHDNVIEVWDDLKERFSKIVRVWVSTLQSQLNSLKQGSKSVLDYFIEIKILWDELSVHMPIASCTSYHKCKCEAMHSARTYIFEDQSILFLISLNDSFSVVKTQEERSMIPTSNLDT